MTSMQPVRSAAKRLAVRMNLIRRPSFIIVGAQKAGTTALHRMLISARGVRGAKRKELHYFDDGFIRYGDVDAYHQCFPHVLSAGSAVQTVEASPEYPCHPLTKVTAALAGFLTLPRDDLGGSVRSNVSEYRGQGMGAAIRSQLTAYFRPHNRALKALLGRELPPSFVC